MTDKIFPQTDETVEMLFAHAKCVAFNPLAAKKPYCLYQTARHNAQTPCRVVFRSVALPMDNGDFVLFDDGTLLHQWNVSPQALEGFKQIAAAAGYPVSSVSGGFRLPPEGYGYSFMDRLNQYAAEKYVNEASVAFEPLPPLKEFIAELFADGNICLTAAKGEDADAECRQYLALMSDGRFLVSEDYADRYGVRDYRKVENFCRSPRKHVFRRREYVPQSYIDALYRQAAEYSWFLPAEAAVSQPTPTMVVPAAEAEKMEQFIRGLLANGNKCLSVVCPSEHLFYSPEDRKYALFADGRLVVAAGANSQWWQLKDLEDEMRRIFPALDIKTEPVPDYYIPEIYRCLLKTQKSAGQIYREMLKQKARKLKKILGIAHYEALELAARITGWKNWREVLTIDEGHARMVINSEKQKKKMAAEMNYDQLQYEYKKYLKR